MSSKPAIGHVRRAAATLARATLGWAAPIGLAVVITGLIGTTFVSDLAQAQEDEEDQPKVSAKGRIKGGDDLINPVWKEAANPQNHRYTFRQPTTTVGKHAKKLTGYLPKELCIVALGSGSAPPSGTPVQVHISGGRTTPVTIVVPEGQNVQFTNDDPFSHMLYDVKGEQGGMAPEETRPGKQRVWKPPAAGSYEIRDKLFPSVRSWIVVEPRAMSTTYPNIKNEFVLPGLAPGEYEVRGYFSGKPWGHPLKIELRPTPEMQQINQPLVLSDKKGKK